MSASEPTTSRSFLSYLRPHARTLGLGVVLLLLTNGLDKLIPWLFKGAVDALTAGELGAVQSYMLGVAGIALCLWAVRTASRVVIFNVGRDVEYQLRNELLARLHQLGSSFFARMSTGDIMSRATNDLGQVRLLAGFGALNVVNATLGYVGAVALMVTLSPELTLWCLAPLPIFALSTRAFSRAMFRRSREAQEALASLSGRAQESLAGVRLVRAFAVEDHVEARFDEANDRAFGANMRLAVLRGIMFPTLVSLAALGKLILIWRGGMMMLDGRLTPGEFFAFYAYLDQLMWPTTAFGFLLSIVQRGRVSYQRVREVLDTEPEVQNAAEPVAAGDQGALEVRRLSHAFGDQRVLDDVSFRVEPEGSLAIVGRTGSGKSTLAALLPRLLPTPAGRVFLDGTDVTQVELRSLRDAVGYAQQEPFLFSTTIAGNIGLALDDPNAPDAFERVVRAARQAAVFDEIQSMPEAFETIVGERGVQLSGGQKQRIALARALLNEPTVLVLDDPLSAVDARTERTILSALDRAGEGRTLVLVTNRIAAAKRMQSVIVLDQGRVVERGTHDELAAGEGTYAKLVARQRIEEELASL